MPCLNLKFYPRSFYFGHFALKVEIILGTGTFSVQKTNRSDRVPQLECMKVVSSILRHCHIVCSNSYLPSSSAKIGIVFCHLVHALGQDCQNCNRFPWSALTLSVALLRSWLSLHNNVCDCQFNTNDSLKLYCSQLLLTFIWRVSCFNSHLIQSWTNGNEQFILINNMNEQTCHL